MDRRAFIKLAAGAAVPAPITFKGVPIVAEACPPIARAMNSWWRNAPQSGAINPPGPETVAMIERAWKELVAAQKREG